MKNGEIEKPQKLKYRKIKKSKVENQKAENSKSRNIVTSPIFSIYMHKQFDINRSGSFGDYLSNKNPDRRDARHTDTLTEPEDLFFRTLGVMKRRENMKVSSRSMNAITNNISLVYARETKNPKKCLVEKF